MLSHFRSPRWCFYLQVNIAGRAAAIAPGSADNLAAFAGVYQTHNLPEVAGKPADAGFELSVSVSADGEPHSQPQKPHYLQLLLVKWQSLAFWEGT